MHPGCTLRQAAGVLAASLIVVGLLKAGAPPAPATQPPTPPAVQPAPETTAPASPDPEAAETYLPILAAWPEPVRAATIALFRKNDQRWAWTYTQRSREETLTIRWDPRRPDDERSWLLERDGAAVTEEEARAYGKEAAEERGKRRPEESERRRERNTRWLSTLRFEPLPNDADTPEGSQGWRVTSAGDAANYDDLPVSDRIRNRILSGLELRLWTRLAPPFEFVRIAGRNTAPLNPYFSVHLRTVTFDLRLAPPAGMPDGPCLPQRLSGAVAGRYLLLGGIDELFESEFRDHTPVGTTELGSR